MSKVRSLRKTKFDVAAVGFMLADVGFTLKTWRNCLSTPAISPIFYDQMDKIELLLMSVHNSVRKPWSVDEDTELLKLVSEYGASGSW